MTTKYSYWISVLLQWSGVYVAITTYQDNIQIMFRKNVETRQASFFIYLYNLILLHTPRNMNPT